MGKREVGEGLCSQVYFQVYTSGHDVRVPCMAIQEVAGMK